jgi:hypothetical protein
VWLHQAQLPETAVLELVQPLLVQECFTLVAVAVELMAVQHLD